MTTTYFTHITLIMQLTVLVRVIYNPGISEQVVKSVLLFFILYA